MALLRCEKMILFYLLFTFCNSGLLSGDLHPLTKAPGGEPSHCPRDGMRTCSGGGDQFNDILSIIPIRFFQSRIIQI